MKILKFGGTSVADAAALRRVVALVREARGKGDVVVVVSAMAGVTDLLAEAARAGEGSGREVVRQLALRHLHCLGELAPADQVGRRQVGYRLGRLARRLEVLTASGGTPATRDAVVAAGEQLSAPLLAAALRAAGVAAVALDARRLIATDSGFGDATVDLERTGRCVHRRLGRLPRKLVPVIPGFYGSDRRGRLTTLGRGGSDTTATVLGTVLQAERVEIFTDVDGVFSAPPRLVPAAAVIPFLTFDEALAIAAHGGKVLHHKSIAPCRQAGVEVRVRNTFRPSLAGTVIGPPRQPLRGVVGVTGRPWEESDPALALLALVGEGVDANPAVTTRARTALAAVGIAEWGVPSPAFAAAFRLAVERAALAEAVAVLHRALVEGIQYRCTPEATWTATRPAAVGTGMVEVGHG